MREPIDRWNTAIRLDPESAVAHFKRALAYWHQSRREADALTDLNRAIELAPDFAQAYYDRSLLVLRQGDAAHALRDLDKAIELGCQSAEAFNNRGVSCAVIGHGGTRRT